MQNKRLCAYVSRRCFIAFVFASILIMQFFNTVNALAYSADGFIDLSRSTSGVGEVVEVKLDFNRALHKKQLNSVNSVEVIFESSSTEGRFSTAPASEKWQKTLNQKLSHGDKVYYKDTRPGKHVIKAKMERHMTNQPLSIKSASLEERIKAAASGDVIELVENEMVSRTIDIDKPLIIKGTRGARIFAKGTEDIFSIKSSGVVIEGVVFEKSDNTIQTFINSRYGATIRGNIFKAVEASDVRALVLSSGVSYLIDNNHFIEVARPVVFDAGVSGEAINNNTEKSLGWTIQGNSNISFRDNFFKNSVVGLLFLSPVPADSSNYSCGDLQKMIETNNGLVIDSQFFEPPCADELIPESEFITDKSTDVSELVVVARDNGGLRSITITIFPLFSNQQAVKTCSSPSFLGSAVKEYTLHCGTEDLGSGEYGVNAVVFDNAGNESRRLVRTFTINGHVDKVDESLNKKFQLLQQPFDVPEDVISMLPRKDVEPLPALSIRYLSRDDVAAKSETIAIKATENGWQFFGISWYWWFTLIVASGFVVYRTATVFAK